MPGICELWVPPPELQKNKNHTSVNTHPQFCIQLYRVYRSLLVHPSATWDTTESPGGILKLASQETLNCTLPDRMPIIQDSHNDKRGPWEHTQAEIAFTGGGNAKKVPSHSGEMLDWSYHWATVFQVYPGEKGTYVPTVA